MTTVANPDLTTTYITPDGVRVEVEANRGTQVISRSSGRPMDATEPGMGHLRISDPGTGEYVAVALTPEVCYALRQLLTSASDVMNSRLRAHDRKPDSA
jgi:hypothetical protein